MKNNQNVLLAIVLSLIVLIGWQYFVIAPRTEAERQRQAAEQTEVVQQAPAAGGTATAPQPAQGPVSEGQVSTGPATPGAPSVPGAATTPAPAIQSRDAAIAATDRVAIETPALRGSINLRGGRIDDLLLADYRTTVDDSSPLVELFSPIGSEHPYYAEFGWVPAAAGTPVPTAQTEWQASRGPLTPDQDVTLSWDNGAGLRFTRTYSVDENYLFSVRQTVENTGGEAVALHPYGLVSRTGTPATSGYYILHEGLIGYLGEEGLQEVDYSDFDDQAVITPPPAASGWLGITDKYWASALVPRGEGTFQGRFVRAGTQAAPTYQSDYLGDAITVPAGGTAAAETLLFAGAKEVSVIDAYEDQLGIPRFELMIDWGWFYFITKPMFVVIDWFYHLLGNFGLAILAVTVLVKLVFFPLANRSYASMSKMKKVQPQMKEIQERHKDDRMAMQQAMMELYKKEKINPIAGCWPILIQIPVFFALYKVLFVTIEMRHAPFFGWIQDLSAPDPTNFFTLFGLIPWDPPQILHLGIWPVIMGFTMFVQMRMNPTPPDKTQAMIFNWMPVLFTFMLGRFPAGLVIYWAWNNTLSVLQQGLIMRKHGVPIELFGNLKGMFGGSKTKDSPAE